MEGLIADRKGQMILLFAFVIVIVVLTLSYVYAQNIIAGIETSRALLAFPKEEIRNLIEIQDRFKTSAEIGRINEEIRLLCAERGWVCYIGPNKVEFKSVEVEYCEGEC